MVQRTLVPNAGEVVLESVQAEAGGQLRRVLLTAREEGACAVDTQ